MTTSILIGSPVEAGGYGFSLRSTSFLYFTPICALILGEAFGHWFNDFVALRYVKRNKGIFVPEVRLWPNYLAVAFMIPGLVLAGQALEFKWNYGVIIVGWGLYVFGVMVCSVCTTAYILDCYPNAAGEVMGYMNFARVMVGRPRFMRWGADFRVGFRLGIISRSGVRSRDLMCRLGFKRWLWRLLLRLWWCFNCSGRKFAIKRVQSNSVGSRR